MSERTTRRPTFPSVGSWPRSDTHNVSFSTSARDAPSKKEERQHLASARRFRQTKPIETSSLLKDQDHQTGKGHHPVELRNSSTSRWYRFQGISPVRSQLLHDDSSTRARNDASLIDKPWRLRYARIRSVSVAGWGDGSLPRNRMIAGMHAIGGCVLFFSQLPIVAVETPI